MFIKVNNKVVMATFWEENTPPPKGGGATWQTMMQIEEKRMFKRE